MPVFETNRMINANQDQTQEIIALLETLTGQLRAQRDILQQRGMNLPPGTLKNLQQAQRDLENLAEQTSEQQIELNRLHTLVDTASLINSSLDTDEVLRRVMDTVIQLTGAERGYIMLRDPKTEQFEFRTARNLDRETVEQGAFIVSRTIADNVAETGEPIVTTNAQSDPRFANQESIISFALRSILCVPLKVKGEEVIGVVYVDNRIRAGLFGESERELLYAFANQAAMAIEKARLFKDLGATLRKITEYEQRLENVFASISSGVITIDMDDIVLLFNQAAESIFAVSQTEALDSPLAEIFPPLDGRFFEMVHDIQAADALGNIEVAPTIPQRGQTILDMKLSPLKDYEQATQGVTILVDDLTEIRKRAATLAEVQRYLPPAMVENIRAIDTIELGGEQREITALFADVRGFTEFSEHLPPEDLMEAINKYLSVSSDAIHLYEGIIDKYMGDAVVGLFNTQLNPQGDDHVLRAVRSAISMAYDVEALHEVLPPDYRLFFGIGVDTGPAVLGNVGSNERKEFTALGNPLDYSKKLQEAAEPGEIILSEATYQRVSSRIETERIERSFRGESEPHVMYKVIGFKREK